MSKRKASQTSKSSKKSRRMVCEYEYEEVNFNDHDQVTIFPNPDDSGESDTDDSDIEDDSGPSSTSNCEVSYKRVFEEYTEKQKKLEPDHVYDWKEGEKEYSEKLNDDLLLSAQERKKIQESTPVDLFELFFSDELKNYIVEATCENGLDISVTDLEKFIGILLLTTYNIRTDQRDYWRLDDDIGLPCVRKVMSRDRFMNIKSHIKYSKSSDQDDDDRAWRVRAICNIFKKNILKLGFVSTALSVDEMMVKFFGRTVLKQYIPSKLDKYGLKLWALCTVSGFMLNFDLYCGKKGPNNTEKLASCPLGSRVVLQMVSPLLLALSKAKLSKFHLYCDNFFTSPDLVVHLGKVGLKVTGVVRKDRIKEKHEFDKKASRGEYKVKHDQNSDMNYISVIDSKPVSFLSTAAGVTPISTMQRFSQSEQKRVDHGFPHVATVYNKYMGGVDLHDYRCKRVSPSIRSKKWTWVIFLRLIQSAVVNANVLWNLSNDKSKEMSSKDFCKYISREYREKKEVGDFSSHAFESRPRQKCSGEKCGLRTTRFCKGCDQFLCISCFERTHK